MKIKEEIVEEIKKFTDKGNGYFAWIPTASNLKFSFFDPDKYDEVKLRKAYYSNIHLQENKSHKVEARKIISSSRRGMKDFFNTESTGNFYYYLVASTLYSNEDKLDVSENFLKGNLYVVSDTAIDYSNKKIDKDDSIKESSKVNLKGARNFHRAIESKFKKLNNKEENLTDLKLAGKGFNVIYNEVCELDKLHDSLSKDLSSLHEKYGFLDFEIINGKIQKSFQIFKYSFKLFRNGFFFLEDNFTDEQRNYLYKKQHEKMGAYQFVHRDIKMAYYYVKQSFHVDVFHSSSNDSIMGVFSFKRLEKEVPKKPEDCAKIIYEHQRGQLGKEYLKSKREYGYHRDVNVVGIFVYIKNMLICFQSVLDKEYFKNENTRVEYQAQIIKEQSKRNLINSKTMFYTLWLASCALAFSLYSGFYLEVFATEHNKIVEQIVLMLEDCLPSIEIKVLNFLIKIIFVAVVFYGIGIFLQRNVNFVVNLNELWNIDIIKKILSYGRMTRNAQAEKFGRIGTALIEYGIWGVFLLIALALMGVGYYLSLGHDLQDLIFFK